MKSVEKIYRRDSVIIGILCLAGMVFGVLSVAYAVDAPDYLVRASAESNRVLLAAFFHLLMMPIYSGTAVLFYPVLKESNPSLALAFAGFRFMAAVFIFIGVILLLMLLTLSQQYVATDIGEQTFYQQVGSLLRMGRDMVNHVAMVLSVCFSSVLLSICLYQSRLVPLWLSVWGLIGAVLAILASLLFMFRQLDILTAIYLALNVPLAIQEIILALWLIFKGFRLKVDYGTLAT